MQSSECNIFTWEHSGVRCVGALHIVVRQEVHPFVHLHIFVAQPAIDELGRATVAIHCSVAVFIVLLVRDADLVVAVNVDFALLPQLVFEGVHHDVRGLRFVDFAHEPLEVVLLQLVGGDAFEIDRLEAMGVLLINRFEGEALQVVLHRFVFPHQLESAHLVNVRRELIEHNFGQCLRSQHNAVVAQHAVVVGDELLGSKERVHFSRIRRSMF